MIDRILSLFGLIRIKKAGYIQDESFKLYARAMADFVYKDFGVSPLPRQTIETDAIGWSRECFNQIMTERTPNAIFIGQWEIDTPSIP